MNFLSRQVAWGAKVLFPAQKLPVYLICSYLKNSNLGDSPFDKKHSHLKKSALIYYLWYKLNQTKRLVSFAQGCVKFKALSISIVLRVFGPNPGYSSESKPWPQRDDIYRALASQYTEQMKFRFPITAWIQLSRASAHGKRLDLF